MPIIVTYFILGDTVFIVYLYVSWILFTLMFVWISWAYTFYLFRKVWHLCLKWLIFMKIHFVNMMSLNYATQNQVFLKLFSGTYVALTFELYL
jgi:hypothetical protein